MELIGVTSAGTAAASAESAAKANADGSFANELNRSVKSTESSLESIFEAASNKYGVPLKLLKAVAKVESSFHADATSRCGAMGIMQLMPRTAKWLGVEDAYDPEQNIMGGAKYLSKLLKQYDGDTATALAAYNAGPGTVRKYGGIPPFAQGYVNKVTKAMGGDLTAGSQSTGSGMSSVTEIKLHAAKSGNDDVSISSLLMLSAISRLRILESSYITQDEPNAIFQPQE